MNVVIWGLKRVWERRMEVHGLKITYEAPILRHFSCKFEQCEHEEACELDCKHRV